MVLGVQFDGFGVGGNRFLETLSAEGSIAFVLQFQNLGAIELGKPAYCLAMFVVGVNAVCICVLV